LTASPGWIFVVGNCDEEAGTVLVELSVVEQRYAAVLEVVRDGLSVVEVAARFGVSRQTVYTWVANYEAGGLAGLVDRSHRPASCPHQIAAELEAAICEMRRMHPGWGQRRIAHELARVRGDAPSESAIYRALARNGLLIPGARRRKKSDYRRWERARPMELWQMDVMEASGWVMAAKPRCSPVSTTTHGSVSQPG
jgi:transposase